MTKPHWHIIIARFFLLIQSAYLMKKCSFMFHRRENCLGSRSADYSCKTLCEFWEDLLNYWAVFKQVVRKYFRIHIIPSVWLNFTFRQYTTTTAAAVWKLLQNWKLRSSWFQTNIKQSCTTSKQLIWWRHRKYICRTTKQNICIPPGFVFGGLSPSRIVLPIAINVWVYWRKYLELKFLYRLM